MIAIRITDALDSALPDVGTVNFIDTESDIQLSLPTSSRTFKTEWRDDNNFRKEIWKNYCLSHAVKPMVMSTDEDPLAVLLRFFEKKERKI